jgi:peptide/nickel transport system substrate-binding protein
MKTLKKPAGHALRYGAMLALALGIGVSAPTAEAEDLIIGVGTLGTFEWAPSRNGHDNNLIAAHWADPFVALDPKTGQLVPGLAESWELSEDKQTWTFKLRPNVPFHDGWGTVTAADVKYTWGEWIAEGNNHEPAQQMSQAIDDKMDNFEIVDDLTFKLHTTRPVLHLPALLCSCDTGLQVVPKKYHDEKGFDAENSQPIATGPWKFVSGTPGVEVVLEAVKDHWRRAPKFDRLIFKEIPDDAARLVQLQSGTIDLAAIDSSLVGEAKAAGLGIIPLPYFANTFLILGGSYWGDDALDKDSPWIQADAPEKGKAIREALSLAIDRQIIVDRILGGYGEIEYGPVFQYNNNPGLMDPSWKLPEYNVELAKQKLAEGGYPDGFEITLFMYPDDIDLPGIAEAIAGMWEEIGIKVTRQPGDEGILDEKLDAKSTDGLAWVKIAKYRPEPASTVSVYRKDTPRDFKFFHPSIDAEYPKMAEEPDQEKRYEIAREILTDMINDTAAISLFNAHRPIIVGPKIADWQPTPGDPELNSLETAAPK